MQVYVYVYRYTVAAVTAVQLKKLLCWHRAAATAAASCCC